MSENDQGGNVDRITKTDEEWRRELSPEQYRVLRKAGTERAFTGAYWDCHDDGVYRCAGCGAGLFTADAKFDSGTGWPSFTEPAVAEAVETRRDVGLAGIRTEVRCRACGSHLGHVFNDGPRPPGKRFCINSIALELAAAGEGETGPEPTATATFGAGCFWGVEAAFRKVPGVTATAVGYAGGHADDPTYRQVCAHRTGHAEAVEVSYDPARVTYEELLDVFWGTHNPTTRNRQGFDIGDQYRSVIFVHDDDQRAAAEASRETLDRSGRWRRPVVTEIEPAPTFWRAEEYHQQYLEKSGKASCLIG